MPPDVMSGGIFWPIDPETLARPRLNTHLSVVPGTLTRFAFGQTIGSLNSIIIIHIAKQRRDLCLYLGILRVPHWLESSDLA